MGEFNDKESKRSKQIEQLLDYGQYAEGFSSKTREHFLNLKPEGIKHKCPLAAALAVTHLAISGLILKKQYGSTVKSYLDVLPDTSAKKICVQMLLGYSKGTKKSSTTSENKLCHYIDDAKINSGQINLEKSLVDLVSG